MPSLTQAVKLQTSFLKGGLKPKDFLHFYTQLLLPRLIEEKMLLLLRKGKLSKWFSGIGQEAVAVGSTLALHPDEYIFPVHRNLGVFTTRNVPLDRLFSQFRGAIHGFTKGRDRSFHFGTHDAHIVGMISHLGAQLGVADGIALACKLKKKQKIVLAFCGEGATSEGDFHEALNLAATWKLPVIFLIENNGYGLSTPSSEQFACKQLIDKGIGYGMEARKIDGNNILSVYHNVRYFAAQMRKNPFPVLLEAMTFRMRGHEEASGTAYVPKTLMEKWERKDPVRQYERWLAQEGLLQEQQKDTICRQIQEQIEEALTKAFKDSKPTADTPTEYKDVYAPSVQTTLVKSHSPETKRKLRLVDAVHEALWQGMKRDKHVILMGQDIAEYGGVFKVTKGFLEEFGRERVRNTPLCESAVIGAALGLAMQGFRAVVEMQFADFVSCGFNQIVNNLAKIHYRWGQSAPVIIRMPTGAGVGAGPFHSQSNEAWFFHTPGLKLLYPSTPFYAKGLLLSALEETNPCLFFEHKALYRASEEAVPEAPYAIDIGKGRIVRPGTKASVITYGIGVQWALKAAQELDYDIEIVDLMTLLPWDKEMVGHSVQKTNRVLVLHEATLCGGIGAEIAAWITEHCFEYLDAPVLRVGSLDTPVPYTSDLEKNFLASSRLKEKITCLMQY